MKLTNNLSTDQRFETYPYNILQKDFAESWNKDVIKVYKEAYNAGFDVHYVLLIVEEFANCRNDRLAKNYWIFIAMFIGLA